MFTCTATPATDAEGLNTDQKIVIGVVVPIVCVLVTASAIIFAAIIQSHKRSGKYANLNYLW